LARLSALARTLLSAAQGDTAGREVPNKLRHGMGLENRVSAGDPVWTDLAVADRQRLAELGRRVGLPLELITYSLLSQRRPEVVPCTAWLYCSWQVPVVVPRPPARGQAPALRLVEIKVCLGPTTVVTMHGRGQRSSDVLPSLLPDGLSLIRPRIANLLVTLVERIGDAYVSAYAGLTGAADEASRARHHARPSRRSSFDETRLFRQVRVHRAAVEKLVIRGRRWLDAREIQRLEACVRRLARMETPAPPVADGPRAL
jgi:Mg2+ and Co2+ transporter CorA